MSVTCMLCKSDIFKVDLEKKVLICAHCGCTTDISPLMRNPAEEARQISVPETDFQKKASDDFKIVGGVLKSYKGENVDVVVPDGVLEIGVRAFMEMTQIRSVRLPESLKVIRREAFWGCVNLQRINIPDSVECIEESIITVRSSCEDDSDLVRHYRKSRCFWGCENLTEIIWRENLDNIYCFEGTAYFENRKESLIEREKRIIKNGYCPKCGTKIVRLFLNGCLNCGKSWVRWNGPIGWGVSANDTYNDLNLQGNYRR